MTELNWAPLDGELLANHLSLCYMVQSDKVGSATVHYGYYEGAECITVVLPSGQGVVVGLDKMF